MSKILLKSAMLSLTAINPVFAQDDVQEFSPDNAILNTAIPFAIGAREAQQELRGSYGWPSFQEGLVEGVYFRFDPDGYARFSPTPRLDTDVFEVLCNPGTISCIGRKSTMTMTITAAGELQIALEDVSTGDQLFIIDGITELPLPPRILQPLDSRLEALLSAGGELIVRRGPTETARVSLTGFSAVSTYLRWILAGQNYDGLPRGWPVPNSTNDSGANAALTQATDWQSQAQAPFVQTVYVEVPIESDEIITTPPDIDAQNTAIMETQEKLESLELKLEQLLLALQGDAMSDTPTVVAETSENDEKLQNLESMMARILLASENGAETATVLPDAENEFQADLAQPVEPATEQVVAVEIAEELPEQEKPDELSRLSEQLNYLMVEVGLDAATALSLLQPDKPAIAPDTNAFAINTEIDVVDEIISEIRAQIPQTPFVLSEPVEADQPITQEVILEIEPVLVEEPAAETIITLEEYQLFSDYFVSSFGRE